MTPAILIVDHDEVASYLLERRLRELDYQTVTVRSLADARAALRAGGYDRVVLGERVTDGATTELFDDVDIEWPPVLSTSESVEAQRVRTTLDIVHFRASGDNAQFQSDLCEARTPRVDRKLRRPRVLLVEDDPVVRSAMLQALGDEGYEVTEAETIADARGHLIRREPDVVVLDFMLLGETSDVLLDELAARRRVPPVIVVSASSSGAAAAEKYAVKFVAKPFNLDALFAEVSTAAAQRHADTASPRVLIVESDDTISTALMSGLGDGRLDVVRARTVDEARAEVRRREWHIVVANFEVGREQTALLVTELAALPKPPHVLMIDTPHTPRVGRRLGILVSPDGFGVSDVESAIACALRYTAAA